jgi:hypothetical protein
MYIDKKWNKKNMKDCDNSKIYISNKIHIFEIYSSISLNGIATRAARIHTKSNLPIT